ncbi:MAG: RDD family protein, partial [Planctomycetota bacterium]
SSDSFMTQTGKVMGTPAFASPEQLRGDDVDVRSDIYAVGATLFALLTARAPFEGDNAIQVVAHVIDTPPPDVSTCRDDLPPGLSKIIARCLAKEPAGRFADYTSLRNTLLPFSSTVPEAAMQSQRTAAGWIDYLAAFLPTYATLMLTVGPEKLFIRPLYEFSLSAWQYPLLVFAVGFLYFAVTEGIWGAGLGKWIMNLRVVTRKGRRPGAGRAFVRIAIPIALIECVRVPLSVISLPSGDWTTINFLLFTGLAIFCPWIAALLWLPARRSNGFATAWDLITGTRVVVQPRGSQRPTEAAKLAATNAMRPDRSIGPFEVTSEIVLDAWLAADDPVLRRPVWLIRRDADVISEARKSVARPSRSRWLQEIEADGAIWDAFEADPGTPIRDRLAEHSVLWSTMRFWLHDLAVEFRAAERDSTAAASYSLDHVWITDDGRAMLLDSPWPLAREPEPLIEVDTLTGQQEFLQTVAARVDLLSVPLHARPVVQNLQSGSFEKITFLAGTLKGLLNKPADLSRGLRSASLFVIPGYASMATFLGIAVNTDPSVGWMTWVGRAAIAVLVMMHFMALFDFVLAICHKSTGLTTFGLEVITERGRAPRSRMLARAAIMWLPVVVPTVILGGIAFMNDAWIPFEQAATLGVVAFGVAGIYAASALMNPARGLHDRLAGVWICRR